MKIERNQPWALWSFVIALNIVGFIGLFILKSKGIDVFALYNSK